MKIENRTTHDVQQGTGAWLRLREGYFTASEAPAALGVSKYVTRAELLRQKHTTIAPEHSAATLGKFAAGHEAEVLARPLAEGEVGGDLYPVTMSVEVEGLRLLASLDGLTLDDVICWETKLWNEELAAAVRAGTLPEHYTVQMDQELLVSGAERCLFTCTDGTPEKFVSCWYAADPKRFDALVAGWHRFAHDLENYTLPPAAEAAPVGKAPETLPALRIEVTGQVTASNLAEFKATALGAIRSVNRTLTTDQDFADAEKAVKWCADVESRLDAAKQHALSQTASIDALFKTIDDISAEARRVRLDLDKLVTRRKTEVKEEAVAAARRALDAHIATLNAEIAPMRLPAIAADFAGTIKGKRSITSMQDALDGLLATTKIAADAEARAIRENLATFKDLATGFEFLFHDLSQIVHHDADVFKTMVDVRIDMHKRAEEKKEADRQAAEAARIAAAEQRARDDEARKIADARAESERLEALAVANRARLAGAPSTAPVLAQATRADEHATMNIGAICGRLGFTVNAQFLSDTLHVAPAKTDKRASLYTEAQFAMICRRLVSHVSSIAERLEMESA